MLDDSSVYDGVEVCLLLLHKGCQEAERLKARFGDKQVMVNGQEEVLRRLEGQ